VARGGPKVPSQGVTRKVYAKAYALAHSGNMPKIEGKAPRVSLSSGREYGKGKATEYKTVAWTGTFDEPQITNLETGVPKTRKRK
jgi:hypothetical protein